MIFSHPIVIADKQFQNVCQDVRKVECVQYVGTEIVEEIAEDDNMDVKDDRNDKNLLRIVVNIVEEMLDNGLTTV